MGTRCVVVCCGMCQRLTGSLGSQASCAGGRCCPRLLLLALLALFNSTISSPGGLPPGSQSARAPSFVSLRGGASRALLPSLGPPCHGASTSSSPFLGGASISLPVLPTSQVDWVSSCDTSRGGQSGSHSWVHGGISSAPSSSCSASPCGRTAWHSPSLRRCSHFRGSASGLCQASCGGASCGGTVASLPSPALSCAHDTNASGLAALAVSATSAGPTLAVSSARAVAVPTTGNAPPPSFARIHARGFDFLGAHVLDHASKSERVNVFGECR